MKVTNFLNEMTGRRASIAARQTHAPMLSQLRDLELPTGWIRVQAEASTTFRLDGARLPSVKVFHSCDAIGLRLDIDQLVDGKVKTNTKKFHKAQDLLLGVWDSIVELTPDIAEACSIQCQYAQDVSMPEHRCGLRCMYTLPGAPV